MTISTDLLNKYNVPIPRYTSYPTVPFWQEGIDVGHWLEVFQNQFAAANASGGISLYLHLPFCESLCTYCGCNKKITTNHSVEHQYMESIMREWKLYRQSMDTVPVIRELHLGGGTPTFFSPAHLQQLLGSIFEGSIIHPQHEFSFEGHPNNTTKEHLKALYEMGFRRVSYGVQDHDPEVQRVINRIQPFENVRRATEAARETGYLSVNFDHIYGLPLQNLRTMEHTILQTISLSPDRIAFYSYAHVPWTSKAQRLFDEHDLPDPRLKMELYQRGKELFTEHGYTDIGMDHFALPSDDLYKAWREGWLHRNFMGYTTQKTNLLLGLGVSSISDAGVAFAQNHKTLHAYYDSIAKGELAVTKGYFLNEEDISFRRYILDIACQAATKFHDTDMPLLEQYTFPELHRLQEDHLIVWDREGLQVTDTGRQFIRNICKAFDLQLLRNEARQAQQLFSKAI